METVRNQTKVQALMAPIEELWTHFDSLFDSLDSRGWQQKHGPDWIFADLPYHLAYFERELIVKVISRGDNVPADAQEEIRTLRDMHAWNGKHFAARPTDQTIEQSLAQMQASRDQIRKLTASMTEADLAQRIWFPMTAFRGWRTIEYALQANVIHSWNEFMQLRLHMKRDEPVPSREITRIALNGFLGIFSTLANHESASNTRFTMVWDFPEIGAWTLRVADGKCTVRKDLAPDTDLTMTQSPEMFVKTFNNMHNPMLAMLFGRIKVRGLRHMGTFAKLFPAPTLDQVFEPLP